MITNAKESHRRKAKGEKLQKEIVADLKKHFPDHADNIKSSPMSAHGEDVQLTEEMVTWYRRPSGIRPPEVAAEHNTYHNPIFLRPPRQCSNVQGSKSPKATEEYWRRRDTYLRLRYTLGTIPEHSAIGDAGGITFASGEEETDKAVDAGWNMAGTAAGEAAEAAARASQAAEKVMRSEAKFVWFLNAIRSRRRRHWRSADRSHPGSIVMHKTAATAALFTETF